MSRLDIIKQNIDTIIGADELMERIRKGKKLRIKLGVDPTRPDLTFGHLVVFNKMKQFQDMGHDCILLIGDYTATIGDPSGRSDTRPVLTTDEVRANAETYLEQAFKVLDEERTLVRYNSEWFNKMSFGDTLNLARKMTVARMLERDDFAKRHASNSPISIVEFLYPLVQGYDSVMLESDVELGGTDQLFNMLVGRQLQKDAGQPEQAVITMPLLVGLDGTKKMSKSADNYISFNHSPKDMFGRVMSISDEAMWDYYRLLLMMDEERIAKHKNDHPMLAKKHLASSLVAMFYSLTDAKRELEQFEQVFAKNQRPDDMPEFTWASLAGPEPTYGLINLMNATDFFPSKKEIRRLIEQGGVKLNDEVVSETTLILDKPDDEVVIQAGKRKFFKIKG
ncbi:tyrosine--tRNA ligase [Cerasicoccus arenae]|uniref:Tyrosine--tRNA ligase n=1 Tax=Cerasicoccus arenae TaxID=424488 RepID=A0A8J3DAC4_9BACT|nr:tyrosine--tRNA ligase [Cerasicoccus arenae]MBK1858097.1 tyrosine--tRNA ligase [Cerasicoccus arenae]GHB96457.1 tyrosine--tRNA ligase [Cerasicoccus arenae]